MRPPVLSLVLAFLLLLTLASVVTPHNVGYSYVYKVYVKIGFEVEGVNPTDPPDPTRIVLVFNGTVESSIVELSESSASLRLRPNLTISGEVEPSKFQRDLEELLRVLNAEINRIHEVNVPLSLLGYAPYEDIQDFIWKNMRVDISWFSASLNVTAAEFITWRDIPALRLKFMGDTNIEEKLYLDPTTFLTLYAEGRATHNFNYLGVTVNLSIEYEMELVNVDVVKEISFKAYRVKFEGGDSRIYVASRGLSVSGLKIVGNELNMKVSGTGLGGITVFTTKNVKIQKILVDNTQVNYQIMTYGDGNIVRIPLTFSEHEVKVIYDKTIGSVEEMSVVQAGTSASILAILLLIVPVTVLIMLLTYLLKRKESY